MNPRELLAAFHQAMLHLSADSLADLFAEDAVYEFPLLTPGRPDRYVGQQEIRDGFGAAWSGAPVRVDAFSEVVIHNTDDPEVIIAEHRIEATVTDTGHQFVTNPLLVLRARDGRIVHVRDYSDSLRNAVELGRLTTLVDRLSQRNQTSGS